MAETATPTDAWREDEFVRVLHRRYAEAKSAGFSHVEAVAFARGDADVGELRRLVKSRCPVELLPKILL